MATAVEQVNELVEAVKKSNLPQGLKDRVMKRLDQLVALVESPTFLPEFDNMSRYLDWILSLPWDRRTKDILDLEYARKALDKNHFGLEDLKARVIEYISVMKLKREKGLETQEIMRAPILCFVGLVGTGKTTIAASIANAMGRKYARIPFGGMGDPLDLRGQSRLHSESEPGKIIKALRSTQSRNCVILLDEIDRVTDQGRSSIMGVLVELLDPKQNFQFVDHYIDYPVDLSEVLFIATANNTHTIATAVLDRLEPISMPSYTDKEKITIGKEYMLPRIMKEAGIREEDLVIEEEVWAQVVRPLGFDAGMRTLERTVQQITRKVARMMVEGKTDSVKITTENLKQFVS
jgi:ATP-dependent Lon protease